MRRRLAGAARLVSLLLLAVAVAPSAAHGNPYVVHVCDGASGYRINALRYHASGTNAAFSTCPKDGSNHAVGAEIRSAAPQAPNVIYTAPGTNAYGEVDAPPGTDIRHLESDQGGRGDQGFNATLLASTDQFLSGNHYWLMTSCGTTLMAGCVGHYSAGWGLGVTALRWQIACAAGWGCNAMSIGVWPYSPAFYFVNDAQVTLEDYWDPTLANGRGALWTSGDWLRGVQHLGFDATDNTGISSAAVQVDGTDVGNSGARACDYSYMVPCSNSGADGDIDTHSLSDGSHTATILAYDASGRLSSLVHTFHVDNSAPGEPQAPSVDGGEDWHTVNDFTIRWTNQSQGSGSPIARAYYELCRSDGTSCTQGSQDAAGIDALQHVTVPGVGDYIVRVWLGDQAGNASGAKTPWMHLKFDNVPPDQAAPQHRNGWVNRDDATTYEQEIDPPTHADGIPVSGIKGYAVTTDGSTPGDTITDQADQTPGGSLWVARHALGDLPEGTTVVNARAISNAGIPSTVVGTTTIHVDLTAPATSVGGAPDPEEWNRSPVSLGITATEAAGQSGMAGAHALTDPDSAGGYIAYSIDGSDAHSVRGPDLGPVLPPDSLLPFAPTATASVSVDQDGTHIVRYQAYDVAGNASGEKSVTFKIDQTPPNVVVFEDQQASDPRLLTIAANDQTSGLADGAVIQLREIRPSAGDWISLRTSRDGNRYYAHIDNATLPPGRYEFRATVPDQAGNVATGNTNRSGQPEQLDIDHTHVGPYGTGNASSGSSFGGPDAPDAGATVPTRVKVGIVTKRAVASTCKKRKRGTRRVCRPCPKAAHAKRGRKVKCKPSRRSPLTGLKLVAQVKVPYGRRVPIMGQLTTGGGSPLRNVEITVLAKPNSVGSQYLGEASVRTGADGAFRYNAPKGPGRTLDFLYRGDHTYKHSDGSVVIRVPAAATIRSSAKAVHNGHSVTFRGRLLSGPVPPLGKLIDVQAFYRRKWRTFATARANGKGGWRYRYRFEATHGLVVYRFRARVRAEAAYPYEIGYSKTIKVKVAG